MAESMIERAARANCEAAGYDWVIDDDGDYPVAKDWIAGTRAVLNAMREPTEAMLSEKALFAGFCQRGDEPEDNLYHDPEDAKQIWQGMIEAALAEETVS